MLAVQTKRTFSGGTICASAISLTTEAAMSRSVSRRPFGPAASSGSFTNGAFVDLADVRPSVSRLARRFLESRRAEQQVAGAKA